MACCKFLNFFIFLISFNIVKGFINQRLYKINLITQEILLNKNLFSNLNKRALITNNKRNIILNASILEDPQVYGYIIVVIIIASGAGSLQSRMFSGDKKGSGLIDFLQDGEGFNKSNYKLKNPSNDNVK